MKKTSPADNIPVLCNPADFPELASVSVPILGIMGEYDDIRVRNLKEDLDFIASKATGCPAFTRQFIQGGNHNYERKEEVFADTISRWLGLL